MAVQEINEGRKPLIFNNFFLQDPSSLIFSPEKWEVPLGGSKLTGQLIVHFRLKSSQFVDKLAFATG